MSRPVTVQLDDHSRLTAIVADIFRAGLDAARVRIGPRAEREIVANAVEALELAGYTITRDEPEQHQVSNTYPQRRQPSVW